MFKTLIAGVTALSLTLAPAQASAEGLSEREIGHIIFGLVAAGIIGKVISDQNRQDQNRHDQNQRVEPAPRLLPDRHAVPLRQQQPTGRDHQVRARNVLPSACLDSYDTQRGQQRIFGARCLERNFANARNLPDQCFIRLRTYDGPRQGYAPDCLRDNGFRIERWN